MSRIASVFNQPRHKALIAYVTVGYPDVGTTMKVVPLLERCGVDVVELGIPFSDPLADGATIQKASHQALKNGITPQTCLKIAGQLREKVGIPLLFMTYFNPVLTYGLGKFCGDCITAGIDGLIVPDLHPDEGTELEKGTQRLGLDLVYLLAPTSTEERIQLVANRSRGFIYLVSVAGVTGARSELPSDLGKFVTRVKQASSLPVCVGFGISTPKQVRQVADTADGVIIGSRLIQLMETDDGSMRPVRELMRQMRKSLDIIVRDKQED
jgi:tryptophan synthase alpha chain